MFRVNVYIYLSMQMIIKTFYGGVNGENYCIFYPDEGTLEFKYLTEEWLKDNNICVRKEIDIIDLVDATYLNVTMYDLITYLHTENKTQEIRYLYIEFSHIPEVRANSFQMFINIEAIRLQSNHLKWLEENSFFNLSLLNYIDLSKNDLVEIGPYVLKGLPQLTTLYIYNNNLRRLIEWRFSNFSNIRDIDLSNNDIEEIGPFVFEGLPNIENINLRNNNLTTLPDSMLPILRKTKHGTQLAGNPWFCDCDLEWMIRIVKKSNKFSDNILCNRPDNITMVQFDIDSLNCDSKPDVTTIATIVVGVAFTLGISIAIALSIWYMRKRATKTKKNFKMMITNRHYYRPQSVSDVSRLPLTPKRAYKSQLSLGMKPPDVGFTELTVYGKVRLVKLLGRGAFGEVYEGTETGDNNIGRKVAVKRIRDNVSPTETESLMKECENLKKVGSHQNIVEVYGSCIINGSRAIVMELAEDGDLKKFLRSYNEANHTLIQNLDCSEEKSFLWAHCSQLYTFMWHIAKGMAYLSSLKILHRDLAARNILLAKGPIAKISDFGLSRDVYESDYYYQETAGRLPYKWMSPETLTDGRYTTKSDVWSYGILLWEIMTLGGSPYPGILPDMLISMHNSGYNMPQPSLCPENIYAEMVECWNFGPDQRPLFKTLVGRVDEIIQRKTNQALSQNETNGSGYFYNGHPFVKIYIELGTGIHEHQSSLKEERCE